MKDFVASHEALKEALSLSENILQDIELNSISLTHIALKTSRLARLIGDFDYQEIFMYEASGYPTTPNGIPKNVWELAKLAGRRYQYKDGDEIKERCNIFSIEQKEYELIAAKESLAITNDPSISISSANPKQYVSAPVASNRVERNNLRTQISTSAKAIAERRSFIYRYVSDIYYNLKYSSIQDDIFSRIRHRVDNKISSIVPEAVKKLSAIYDNLSSDNNEDWSNAVHSCRRILQDAADALYPPREDKGKIKLGKDNYINRLIAYVEEHSKSLRFEEIVGSHLKYMGERLDSIFQAAQKGSHYVITTQDEADRYTIYTYLILGDILHLSENSNIEEAESVVISDYADIEEDKTEDEVRNG